MNINEYLMLTERTRSILETKQLNNLHMALGLVTESGEIADVLKKNLAYNKEIDYINLQEEMGDICWYLAGLCNINGFDFEKILQTNIDKLRSRYPDKFTNENALNRDLDAERQVLENLK